MISRTPLFRSILGILPVLLWPLCTVGGEKVAEDLVVTQPRPLIRAHAHNDYLHERPLLDVLSHGFCGVEEGKVEKKAFLLSE